MAGLAPRRLPAASLPPSLLPPAQLQVFSLHTHARIGSLFIFLVEALVSPPAMGSRVSVASTSIGDSRVSAATLEAAGKSNNLCRTIKSCSLGPHGRTLLLDTLPTLNVPVLQLSSPRHKNTALASRPILHLNRHTLTSNEGLRHCCYLTLSLSAPPRPNSSLLAHHNSRHQV